MWSGTEYWMNLDWPRNPSKIGTSIDRNTVLLDLRGDIYSSIGPLKIKYFEATDWIHLNASAPAIDIGVSRFEVEATGNSQLLALNPYG